jgi:hypothetical protein
VRCVGHNLLALEDAGFDQLANLMMTDTQLCSRVTHYDQAIVGIASQLDGMREQERRVADNA